MQKKCRKICTIQIFVVPLHAFSLRKRAPVAELVDALVSNTNGKPCRFDPGPGYKKKEDVVDILFFYIKLFSKFEIPHIFRISNSCRNNKGRAAGTPPRW